MKSAWFKKKAVILACLFVVSFSVGLWARSQADRWPTGDEPNYAIMAEQLVTHGNLDLKPAFAEKKYIGKFYGWEVEPQVNWSYFSKSSPHWYSLHSAGLPLLVAPSLLLAYTLHLPPLTCLIVFMTLIGSLTVLALWCLSYEVTRDKAAATFSSLVLLLSTSFLSLTGTLFPDMPTALLLITALWAIIKLHRQPQGWLYLLAGSSAAFLVILHAKNSLVCLTIGLILLYEWYKQGRKLSHLLLLSIVPVMILAIYTLKIHDWYGTWILTSPFGNGQLFILAPGWSIVASLFDSTKGLLFNNPVFFLAFAGIPIWYKEQKASLLIAASLVFPSLLIQSTFNDWAGGYSPIGRYTLAYLVVLLPAIAFLWARCKERMLARLALILLLSLQACTSLFYMAKGYMWNYAGEANPILATLQHKIGLQTDISSPIFAYSTKVTSGARWLVIALEVFFSVLLVFIGIHLAKKSTNN